MKKNALFILAVVGLLTISLSLGAQQGLRRGIGSPVKALGPGPKGTGVQPANSISQYPTSTTLGYRGVVAADVNIANDAMNIDEFVCDFGALGVWVMEGYSSGYDNSWNLITGVNPEWIMSVKFLNDGSEAIIGDFGALGLWKWTYNGYPGNWVQLSGVNPDAGFAVDDDGDGLQELQVDFGSLGIWRYDDNGGGAATWNQYSGLNPTSGTRMATVPPASDQGAWSFSSAGFWRLWWSGGPNYAQLTGVPIAGNDDDSGKFLGGSGEDLVLDFGALGLWLLKNDTAADWHQIIPQQTAFARTVKFAGSADDMLLFVYQSTPGLNVWNYSNFPGTITNIQTVSPDSDGAVEPFDPDVATSTDTDDELAVDMGTEGLWLFDSATSGWAQLNVNNPVFMVRGNFWTDAMNTTLIVNFGTEGLWLYDGAYDVWWPISPFSPDSNYGF
jgi:hypothetical protein